MRVRCIDPGLNNPFLVAGKVYNTTYADNNHYELLEHPGLSWFHNRFMIEPDEPKKDTRTIQGQLMERIEFLEAKMRQFQDQLDNHDHKTNIDFTVEKE